MSVRVTFLGAGDAFNSGARCHACCLVAGSTTRFLLDCGPTALLALKRDGFSAVDLDAILVSHLHGDHFAGIPFLLLECVYETPRRRPLTIAGPPGTETRVMDLYRTMYRELAARPLPFGLDCIELTPGVRTRVGAIDVFPFRVPHQEQDVSLGLRVDLEGKSILYSGDTGWTEDLVTHSQGADLFICECCYFETRTSFHLDYPRIAENSARFGSRRLILTHVGREVLARRSDITIDIAADGLTIEL